MIIKARIDIFEVKEDQVLSMDVEVPSIEEEVDRITKHLNPLKKYKIRVTPDLPGMDPEKCGCIFNDLNRSCSNDGFNVMMGPLSEEIWGEKR